jgi:hypothetical protein
MSRIIAANKQKPANRIAWPITKASFDIQPSALPLALKCDAVVHGSWE